MEIPEFAMILDEVKSLRIALTKKEQSPEWFNDEECWKAKGGCSLSTYRSNRFYQCKGGIPDGYVGGRKVWNRKSVEEWISITDDRLEEYHRKYKTGAKKR